MSDIVKIREWLDTDEPEPEHGWDWPHPPINVESRVQGQLRTDILANLGHNPDDQAEVRIIETEIEGGWSEFTVEVDHDIEVWVHRGRQAQKVWSSQEYSSESAMAKFLAWATTRATDTRLRESIARLEGPTDGEAL